jgi:hypothetical protein
LDESLQRKYSEKGFHSLIFGRGEGLLVLGDDARLNEVAVPGIDHKIEEAFSWLDWFEKFVGVERTLYLSESMVEALTDDQFRFLRDGNVQVVIVGKEQIVYEKET